jgi:Protein of unknown function (DUF2442)
MIGVMPDITEATVIRHGVLHLRFADGLSGEVEVLDRIRGPVFNQAHTGEGFAEVTVDAETGTVVWPGGADLAPDTLNDVSAPVFGQTRSSPRSTASRTLRRCARPHPAQSAFSPQTRVISR